MLSLGSQAGASDPFSLASMLADSSVSESPPLAMQVQPIGFRTRRFEDLDRIYKMNRMETGARPMIGLANQSQPPSQQATLRAAG